MKPHLDAMYRQLVVMGEQEITAPDAGADFVSMVFNIAARTLASVPDGAFDPVFASLYAHSRRLRNQLRRDARDAKAAQARAVAIMNQVDDAFPVDAIEMAAAETAKLLVALGLAK